MRIRSSARHGTFAASLLVLVLGSAALAQEASPTADIADPSLPPGHRLEVPEAGVAVTVPPDWTVLGPNGGTHAVSPAEAICRPIASRLDEPATDPDAFLDDMAVVYRNFFDDGPLPVIDEAELELPAGRAIRLVSDFEQEPDRDPQEDRRFATMYLLTDGQVSLLFGCWANERPEDDWLAIAETLEYLPIAE